MNAPRVSLLACALAALAVALLPLPASAGIKCWTNDDGVRECGNTVPPKYAQKAHRELTGVLKKKGSSANVFSESEVSFVAQLTFRANSHLLRFDIPELGATLVVKRLQPKK